MGRLKVKILQSSAFNYYSSYLSYNAENYLKQEKPKNSELWHHEINILPFTKLCLDIQDQSNYFQILNVLSSSHGALKYSVNLQQPL